MMADTYLNEATEGPVLTALMRRINAVEEASGIRQFEGGFLAAIIDGILRILAPGISVTYPLGSFDGIPLTSATATVVKTDKTYFGPSDNLYRSKKGDISVISPTEMPIFLVQDQSGLDLEDFRLEPGGADMVLVAQQAAFHLQGVRVFDNRPSIRLEKQYGTTGSYLRDLPISTTDLIFARGAGGQSSKTNRQTGLITYAQDVGESSPFQKYALKTYDTDAGGEVLFEVNAFVDEVIIEGGFGVVVRKSSSDHPFWPLPAYFVFGDGEGYSSKITSVLYNVSADTTIVSFSDVSGPAISIGDLISILTFWDGASVTTPATKQSFQVVAESAGGLEFSGNQFDYFYNRSNSFMFTTYNESLRVPLSNYTTVPVDGWIDGVFLLLMHATASQTVIERWNRVSGDRLDDYILFENTPTLPQTTFTHTDVEGGETILNPAPDFGATQPALDALSNPDEAITRTPSIVTLPSQMRDAIEIVANAVYKPADAPDSFASLYNAAMNGKFSDFGLDNVANEDRGDWVVNTTTQKSLISIELGEINEVLTELEVWVEENITGGS